MKHFLLYWVLLIIHFNSKAQCPAPANIAAADCTPNGSAPAANQTYSDVRKITTNTTINGNLTFQNAGGIFIIQNGTVAVNGTVNIRDGASLRICGGNVRFNALTNSNGNNTIVINSGATLTLGTLSTPNNNMLWDGTVTIMNYGNLILRDGINFQNNNVVLINAGTITSEENGGLRFENSTSRFINRGSAQFNQLRTNRPNNIILEANSNTTFNSYNHTASNPGESFPIRACSGPSTVTFTGAVGVTNHNNIFLINANSNVVNVCADGVTSYTPANANQNNLGVGVTFQGSVAQPSNITGPNSVCPGSQGVVYSVPTVTGATSYNWQYSGTGVTINGTGNLVTLNFATNATVGNLTVSAVGICGSGPVSNSLNISFSNLPTPASQPQNLSITSTGTTNTINFSSPLNTTNLSGYIILRAISNTQPALTVPVVNTNYSVGDNIGVWSVVGINNTISNTSATDNVGTGHCNNNVYYAIYSFNSNGGACITYNTVNPLQSFTVYHPKYVWNGNNTNFSTASNWAPNRSTAQNCDILEFNNSNTVNLTIYDNQTFRNLSSFRIINNTTVNFNGDAEEFFLHQSSGNQALFIENGSQLNLQNVMLSPQVNNQTYQIDGRIVTSRWQTLGNPDSWASIRNINNPNIVLGNNSIVEFNGSLQRIANRNDYKTLILSGTNTKFIDGDVSVDSLVIKDGASFGVWENATPTTSILNVGSVNIENGSFNYARNLNKNTVVNVDRKLFVQNQGRIDALHNTGIINMKSNLINNGNIEALGGSINFDGNTLQSISGTGVSQFFSITINKTTQNVRLEKNIAILGNLEFQQGSLDLNGQELNLRGVGTIVNETNQNRILCNKLDGSGKVVTNAIINHPSTNFNPGNLGFSFTTTGASLGNTSIERILLQSDITQSNNSIAVNRIYSIEPEPSLNNNLNLSFRAAYFHNELGIGVTTNDEVFFVINRSTNQGLDWIKHSSNSIAGISYVDFNGWNQFSWVGIGIDDVDPLPVSLLNFNINCFENKIEVVWQTASEIDVNEYLVEGFRNNEWKTIARQNANQFSNTILNCKVVIEDFENIELIRLSEVSLSGVVNELQTIKNDCKYLESKQNTLNIFPNPNDGILNLEISNLNDLENYSVEILNHSGQIIYSKIVQQNSPINFTQIDISHLNNGIYLVRVYLESQNIYHTKTLLKK